MISLAIVPNVSSLRSMTISTQFQVAYNMRNNNKYGWLETNVDTHMMKNIEWGAVAYLSNSIYGKNLEININSTSYTGGGINDAYKTNIGQSTTGTIYGIYDMNGGAFEYVAAYIDTSSSLTYGNNIVSSEIKYKDTYINVGDHSTNYNSAKNMFGDAVYEISSSSYGLTSWYSNTSYMPREPYPFFFRGGDGSSLGALSFSSDRGNLASYFTFRPVFFNK